MTFELRALGLCLSFQDQDLVMCVSVLGAWHTVGPDKYLLSDDDRQVLADLTFSLRRSSIVQRLFPSR